VNDSVSDPAAGPGAGGGVDPLPGPRPSVAVLDYGSGNLRSVVRALETAGADVTLTSDVAQCLAADGLVVPGVGAFEACMDGLRAVHGPRIIGSRLAGARPVLGICVGMQVLFDEGVEHGVRTDGCGEWPGTVERLQAPIVPHMGWNTVEPEMAAGAGSAMFDGIADERFYFVHSYAVRDWTMAPHERLAAPTVTWASYAGERFVAAVENGPLWATQFHPEKSGDAGARLLRNWLATLRPQRAGAPAGAAAGAADAVRA
jgi:glutamine amidotransferase